MAIYARLFPLFFFILNRFFFLRVFFKVNHIFSQQKIIPGEYLFHVGYINLITVEIGDDFFEIFFPRTLEMQEIRLCNSALKFWQARIAILI